MPVGIAILKNISGFESSRFPVALGPHVYSFDTLDFATKQTKLFSIAAVWLDLRGRALMLQSLLLCTQ